MVTFYELVDGKPHNPALFLDTLKVSTIEQTAESTYARGGKGNAALISWDYGKEITVTLEDALFSAKSMAIMFGNGAVGTLPTSADASNIMRTEVFKTGETGGDADESGAKAAGWEDYLISPDGKHKYKKLNPKFYDVTGASVSVLDSETKYFCSYDLATVNAGIIEISANSFPGTYYVTGDTYARSEADGKDEFFQFIIPKAKVTSENTITLEAEGDPSVFNLSLHVLRPAGGGAMMKLVKYDMAEIKE